MKISGRAEKYVLQSSEFRRLNWNGREIRNAFQTAVALAEYEHRHIPGEEQDGDVAELDQKHFEVVFEAAEDFKGYLDAVRSGDDAYRAGQRMDRFETEI